jgi:hypothetical protein
VNACAGLSTEALERGALGKLFDKIRDGRDMDNDAVLRAKLEGK